MIGGFDADSVAAQAAGLQPGDRIVSVDGSRSPTWEQFYLVVLPKANRQQSRSRSIAAARRIERQVVPARSASTNRRHRRPAGDAPADHGDSSRRAGGTKAGCSPGDVVHGRAASARYRASGSIELIKSTRGQAADARGQRATGSSSSTITVTPRRIGERGHDRRATSAPSSCGPSNPGPLEALKLSVQQNWDWTKLIVKTLGGLFTRETSVKQLMGPVAIAGSVWRRGASRAGCRSSA